MKYLWVDEMLNYSPISNSELQVDELYCSTSACELYNENVLEDWTELYPNAHANERVSIEDFIWC